VNPLKNNKGLVFVMFILFAVLVHGVAPNIDNLYNNIIFNLTEDVPFNFTVVATDADGDYPLVFTDDHNNVTFPSFQFVTINDTHARINVTPTNDEITIGGFKIVKVIATDNESPAPLFDAIQILFNISNVNDPPNVTIYTPGTSPFNVQIS